MTFRVDPKKVTHYLLNPSHPVGGAKGVFFGAAGFSAASPADVKTFVDALIGHAQSAQHSAADTSRYRIKHVFTGTIRSPDGRNPGINGVWQLKQGDWWLVTAIPLGDGPIE